MTEDQRAKLTTSTHSHLQRMARLAYLAPDIVRAILAGTQPAHLTGRSLWRMAFLPVTWADQRKLLRCPAV